MGTELNHLGIILDGNRRYAKKLGLQPWKGHEEGAKRVEEVIKASLEFKIKELTLYTFSTENFKRNKKEVDFLMKLFKKSFEEFLKRDYIKKIKINFAGDKSLFSDEIRKMMNKVEEMTKDNKGLIVNFAMGYSGKKEIVNSVRKIIAKGIKAKDVDEKTISENLYIKNDVDLIIRTSGEKRTSGFLLWQGDYAELLFVEKFWPQFTRQDLKDCIDKFHNRKRRFGQ